ncbi:MAG: hypothetical protein MHPSP_003329 [Paramarteilia canceri]
MFDTSQKKPSIKVTYDDLIKPYGLPELAKMLQNLVKSEAFFQSSGSVQKLLLISKTYELWAYQFRPGINCDDLLERIANMTVKSKTLEDYKMLLNPTSNIESQI